MTWDRLDAAYQLRRFCYQNSPTGLAPEPIEGDEVSDHELRQLLLFAGRLAQGDRNLPRTLEALRVVWLVPEDVGAALFGGVA